MKVLITGHDGYIGSEVHQEIRDAGHEVTCVDTFFFSRNRLARYGKKSPEWDQDVRDLVPEGLEGFDAVIHLAALSNDPLGEINPELTYEINHKASVNLAKLAKEAGVRRFLFASTCSVYGTANQEQLATEDTPLQPLSHYAISKVRAEEDLSKMADGSFSPVFLRNATAYGWSSNFRSDLVVNNLACWAFTTGEIRILSDGTAWRPVVHVKDIARAFAAALIATREAIHNQAINVGQNIENYQVKIIAEIVRKSFPDCKVTYGKSNGADPRSYRVDFSKLKRALPKYRPIWSVRRGVKEMKAMFIAIKLTEESFCGPKYVRLARLKTLMQDGELDDNLRWKTRTIYPQSR